MRFLKTHFWLWKVNRIDIELVTRPAYQQVSLLAGSKSVLQQSRVDNWSGAPVKQRVCKRFRGQMIACGCLAAGCLDRWSVALDKRGTGEQTVVQVAVSRGVQYGARRKNQIKNPELFSFHQVLEVGRVTKVLPVIVPAEDTAAAIFGAHRCQHFVGQVHDTSNCWHSWSKTSVWILKHIAQ